MLFLCYNLWVLCRMVYIMINILFVDALIASFEIINNDTYFKNEYDIYLNYCFYL